MLDANSAMFTPFTPYATINPSDKRSAVTAPASAPKNSIFCCRKTVSTIPKYQISAITPQQKTVGSKRYT